MIDDLHDEDTRTPSRDDSVAYDYLLDDSAYDVDWPRDRRRKPPKFKQEHQEIVYALAQEGDDSRRGFKPSFSGSKHERQWIQTYLGPFYEDQVIVDVLHQVKGGKEANVYCCRAHASSGADLLAAKVYRPRMFRNLRNDARYRKGRETIGEEGKEVRGRREKLAMKKKTTFGQMLRHTTWLANEYETLSRLHAAGADVCKPFAMSDNVILMEYVGDEKDSAPELHRLQLEPRAARRLFDRLYHDVELMLMHDRVHADLSAFNILYWDDEPRIIDFPQAVDPFTNPDAFDMLARDLDRLCGYFDRYGMRSDPGRLARDLWDRIVMHQGQGQRA